ncbi:MAG: hypothetical protein SF051_16635 [Elusimicrobiota bacterium]|nr:hypothetical protein [Elusimicrobiota bacterium]
MSRGSAVVAALLVGLLAGVWTGSALQRSASRKARRQGPDVERLVRKLERSLSLDAAQSAKVREALESRRGRHDALKKESHERFVALRAEVDRDIEAVLTDDQKARFARLRAEWEKKHAR